MKIKQLVKKLLEADQNGEVLISNDEELNTLMESVEITELTDVPSTNVPHYVLYGLTSSEIDL